MGVGGIGTLGVVTARKPKALPADAKLVEQIRETVRALDRGPADTATVGLAVLLAETIDSLDGEMRAKMLAQTSGQLLNVLRELRSRSTVPAVPGRYPPGTNLLKVGRRAG